MKHDNELWYITEHYAEALQQLVRAKGLNRLDRIAHLKCALANQYVDFSKTLQSRGIFVDDIVQKLKNSTDEIKYAMTLKDKAEVLKIFDKVFFDILNMYEDKTLHLVRSSSQKVHDHISNVVSDWDLDNLSKSKTLKVIRSLKLHPVLAKGVEALNLSERAVNFTMDKNLLDYLGDFLNEVDVLLNTASEGTSYDVFLDDVNNRVYNFMLESIDYMFNVSDLKTYKYLLLDSRGGRYSLTSAIPLAVLRDLLVNDWYCNKTGDVINLEVEENVITDLHTYKGIFFESTTV